MSNTRPKGNLERITESIEKLAGVPIDTTTPNYLDEKTFEDRLAYALEELANLPHPDATIPVALRTVSPWDRITEAVVAYCGGESTGTAAKVDSAVVGTDYAG